MSRVNIYSGLRYIDDPSIMSWQIANEPRAFSDDAKPQFAAWIKDITAWMRS